MKVTVSDPEGSVGSLREHVVSEVSQAPAMLPDGVTLESIEVREVVTHA